MNTSLIVDQTFDKIDTLPKGEYDNCTFSNCDFSSSDFSGYKFTDCSFDSCNLSLTKLNNTVVRDVTFTECKLLGLRFDTTNDFGFSVSFDSCQLNHSSFYKRKMKQTAFKNSLLQEVDFSEADLSSALFENCDLRQATFDQTLLEKADFRTAFNYAIDPERNKLKNGKFSLNGLPGLVLKYGLIIEK